MSQVPDDSGRPPVRLGRGAAEVARRAGEAVAESWAALRTAPRRTVVAELLLCASAASFGLTPLLLVRPDRPVLAVLEALWATLLVAARRDRPVAAVLGVSPLLVGHNVWTLAAVALVVLSATRRIAPTRRAWQVVGTACATVAPLTVVRVAPRWEDLPVELAGNAVSVVLLLLLPALAGTLLGRRRLLVDLLRERNSYLEQARSLSVSAARLEERNRIAGEMHDLLGHRLSLISVHAGALELATARQAPPLSGQAELLRTTAGTAMAELREILGVLRHTDPADGSGSDRGTCEDITALVTEYRRTGGAVELDWSVADSAVLGDRTRQAIHRVVREGLTNVLKHASGASTRVEVRSASGGTEVSVTNGVPRTDGRSQGGTRSGLAGLQERISLLGGAFEAGAVPGGGFRVAAWLPPQAQAQEHAPAPAPAPVPAGTATGQGGSRSPLSDEILTWPRVLGAGCAAVLVILPTVGYLMFLLLTASLG
ncbi:sensor histidine kinase [Streptomyces sp. WI04-05B]|uniref:sensor histidine kinase n=1 Tax=Streptomyces TaxID=1883 RepID=UPI0029B27B10|nr:MULTISPECIES: histidine kinase [unclassified Streptomyces]MDX2540426.1 histidine kinase [Streptomyces sp. WI04-05B]MDX2585141.1 histidine kinase [Streptomyces sp. WI04-05A]